MGYNGHAIAIRRIIDSGGIKTMLCEEGLYEHIRKHVDTFQIKKEKGVRLK